MGGRPRRRRREVRSIGKLFREVAGNLTEGSEFRLRQWLENDFVAVLLDLHFTPLKSKGAGNADGLTAPMLKNFRGFHSYII
ncbi:MAG: hypothetical protein RL693_1305 [Verrucomicrobiota bacterium]